MKSILQLAMAAVTGLVLTACASTERLSAANDVHGLLVAIRDDDRAAFDAHVDRRALEAQNQSVLVERATAHDVPDSIKGLSMVASGPLARMAGQALIRPDVFRAIADYYGYRPQTPIPGRLALAGVLRSLPDRRVCAARGRDGPCLLTFADEGGTWRLVAFNGDAAMLKPGRRGTP